MGQHDDTNTSKVHDTINFNRGKEIGGWGSKISNLTLTIF